MSRAHPKTRGWPFIIALSRSNTYNCTWTAAAGSSTSGRGEGEEGVRMSSWSELLDRAEPEEHIVQLYGGDDPLLTRNASRFLAEGLRSGDGLIVISTSAHAEAILRQLNQASVNPSQALEDGRLVFLDARTT